MSKRVLLYSPPSSRSIALETIAKMVIEAGHELFLLTLSERGPLHEMLDRIGAKTYSYVVSHKPSYNFYFKHCVFLIRFCKKNKIDTVWSQLATANLISVFSQQFLRSKIIAFRHHDESSFYAQYGKKFGMVRKRNEILVDKLINRFARHIVVLSRNVLETMKQYEHCDERKIIVCPLIYDFSLYPVPEQREIQRIKDKAGCRLLLIMVSRMILSKQHELAFEVVNKLIKEGLSIKMLVLDDGPLKERLVQYIDDNDLSASIELTGNRTDFVNYMAASDLLVHPSLTEASSNVVKEMALLNKPVAICSGVGDFDDYISEGYNGYILSRDELSASLEKAIRSVYNDSATGEKYGRNLHIEVIKKFSDSPENKKRYQQLF
jgi:glycosyltransferase involved in cell wall biosynthesis